LRLQQAAETRISKPPVSLGVAALMSCTAFPWLLPDLADALLEQIRAFVQEGRFGELHFTLDADLRSALFAAGSEG
jgi:hypothetical protein